MSYCQNCDSWVSPTFVRVFGIDGEVEACRNCATLAEISHRNKSATDAAIPDWRDR